MIPLLTLSMQSLQVPLLEPLITLDIIAFMATLPYEMFLEKTALLNQLETFPHLTVRRVRC